ncbi:DNA primase, partial [Arsenicicoccus bolidensis]|uniref:DNA primase n=1 Tax=Arsenicicoccus bolidensis TaxID=229480 RepID=UPI0028AFD7B4
MALIKPEDIAQVKERTSIEDVVREHVTLRSAGPGSLKGLCPFHDEKTPSFTVRPAVGAYHCFGCGEGGDVIRFVQEVDHLSFVEAVERLAARSGVELRYEDGDAPQREPAGKRQRLVEAHRVASEFYAEALLAMPEARAGRDFLRAKGFSGKDCAVFGVGYAPRGGELVTHHLRAKGFNDDEIVTSGLAAQGRRGPYDRFRGRVVWPIRDVTGDTVGFGARRIFDDDRIEAKYLNTSETPIYKKTSVLYGLDLAKRAMARDRQAVIVEGYTDVMACHLAGVEQAVATCGTSFGVDHIKTLRRILRDEAGQSPAKVIFTFDGDAAGQKAAMRAFAEDQRWASQSFVAVADAGQDPNELR